MAAKKKRNGLKRERSRTDKSLTAERSATDQTMSGIILVVIGVPAVLMDNFLRPVLIKRGADLPLLLIILGVIGGLLAFGVLGLFLGPVILAVTYTLLQHWVAEAKD